MAARPVERRFFQPEHAEAWRVVTTGQLHPSFTIPMRDSTTFEYEPREHHRTSRDWPTPVRWLTMIGFWLAWQCAGAVGAQLAVWNDCSRGQFWPSCGNGPDAALYAWIGTLPGAVAAAICGMRLRTWAHVYFLALWLLGLLAWMAVLAWPLQMPWIVQVLVPVAAAFWVRRVVERQARSWERSVRGSEPVPQANTEAA